MIETFQFYNCSYGQPLTTEIRSIKPFIVYVHTTLTQTAKYVTRADLQLCVDFSS